MCLMMVVAYVLEEMVLVNEKTSNGIVKASLLFSSYIYMLKTWPV